MNTNKTESIRIKMNDWKRERYRYLFELSKYEDFDVQIETIDKDKRFRSKWESFSLACGIPNNFISDKIVHRKVLSNELVFDFDSEIFGINLSCVFHLVYVLTKKNFKYTLYFSGGKGFHVHLFFDYEIINSYEDKEISKLSDSKKITAIRNKVLVEIFKGFREAYEFIRPYMDWQIIEVFRKLIRAEGYKHHSGKYKQQIVLDKPEDIFNWEYQENLEFTKPDLELNQLKLIEPFEKSILFERYLRMKRSTFSNNYKDNNYLRSRVYEFLSKPLRDGRKTMLFILCSEMRGKGWSKDKIISFINKWNSIQTEPLNDITIQSQINQICNKDVSPLRNETINKYLKQVVFED